METGGRHRSPEILKRFSNIDRIDYIIEPVKAWVEEEGGGAGTEEVIDVEYVGLVIDISG